MEELSSSTENESRIGDVIMGTPTSSSGWKGLLTILEIIWYAETVVCGWVLASMVVYGFKKSSWITKPEKSSLSSGLIYNLCLATTAVFIPELIATKLMFAIPSTGQYSDPFCNSLGDFANIAHLIALFCAHSYMWFMQRKIYLHPHVRPSIGQNVDWCSRGLIVVYFINAAAFGTYCVISNTFEASEVGCVRVSATASEFMPGIGKNVILAVSLVVIEIMTVFLFIYPVLRVKFETNRRISADISDGQSTTSVCIEMENVSKSKISLTGEAVKTILPGKDYLYSTPVQAVVNRTMIISIIILVSNIASLSVVTVFDIRAPYVLRQSIYSTASFVNVICIMFIFPFANRVIIAPFSLFTTITKNSSISDAATLV